MAPETSINTGATIVDASGDEIGSVEHIQGGYFSVGSNGEERWLSSTYVESADGNRVNLSLERDDLEEHLLLAPGIEASDDTHRETAGDAIISDQDMLAQRERMERVTRPARRPDGHRLGRGQEERDRGTG